MVLHHPSHAVRVDAVTAPEHDGRIDRVEERFKTDRALLTKVVAAVFLARVRPSFETEVARIAMECFIFVTDVAGATMEREIA